MERIFATLLEMTIAKFKTDGSEATLFAIVDGNRKLELKIAAEHLSPTLRCLHYVSQKCEDLRTQHQAQGRVFPHSILPLDGTETVALFPRGLIGVRLAFHKEGRLLVGLTTQQARDLIAQLNDALAMAKRPHGTAH
jgi:hypothetical protein